MTQKTVLKERIIILIYISLSTIKVAGVPPVIVRHSLAVKKRISRNSPVAIRALFKDLINNKILTFPSLNMATKKMGVKYDTLKRYINSIYYPLQARNTYRVRLGDTQLSEIGLHKSKPLKGRYILKFLGSPKKKVKLNEDNFKKLIVSDVTLGVPNQTIYPSVSAFAKAISNDPNYVRSYL